MKILLVFFICFFIACKKDKKNTETKVNETVIEVDTSIYACKTLPNAPLPFGWRDTTLDGNKNIHTFMYNPANPNEIVFVTAGDLYGYNNMYYFDVPNKKIKFLTTISDFAPQINKFGWILYNTYENNIFKVKCNGDSLTQLTQGYNSQNPQWDYSQVNFYYFQIASGSFQTQLIRTNKDGFAIMAISAELPNLAPLKKANQVLYSKTKDNTISLLLRNVSTNTETPLFTLPYNSNSTVAYFNRVTLDQNDENIYWSGAAGIIRYNLAYKKFDTILKNCQTVKYANPIFQTIKPGLMLCSAHFIKSISAFELLHNYKAIEYNLLTHEKVEVRIFP